MPTRREFLVKSAGAAVCVGTAALLAACQAPAPPATSAAPTLAPPQPPTSAPAPAAAAPKPTTAPVAAAPPTAVPVAAPKPTVAPAAVTSSGIVTVLQTADIESWDPNVLRSMAGTNIAMQVQDTLVDRYLKPQLATTWKSLDNLTWQFDLRPNVKFHNGDPVDAEAVKFSLERVLDPGNKGASGSLFQPVLDHVEVVSATSVKLITKTPFSALPDLLVDAFIVSPKSVTQADFAKVGYGSGAYRFKEWVPSERVVLEANPDYWGPKPAVQQIVFRTVAEPSVRLVELQSGNADVIYSVPPDNASDLDAAGLAKVQHRGTGAMRIVFKADTPQFSDVRVRQALNYAVDKQGILTGVLRGAGYLLNGPIVADMFGYNETLQPYPYDPNKAQQLLKEAGVQSLEATWIMTNGRYLRDRAIGEAVVDQLSKVGVKINANFVEFGTWIQQFNKVGEGYLVQGEDTYPHRVFTTLSSRIKAFAWYGYTNTHVDDLIEQGAATFDDAKRRDIYRELDQIVRDEGAWLYLFNSQDTFGLRDKLKGFNPNAAGYFYARDLTLA
jgi:peptide/nickel transport system substrate-binding protein